MYQLQHLPVLILLPLVLLGSGAFEQKAVGGGSEAGRLHELLDEEWEFLMREFPEFATYAGYPGQNHRWRDNSLEVIDRRKKRAKQTLADLESIHRSKLSRDDQLDYDLYLRRTLEKIEGQRFKEEYLLLNQLEGVQQDVAQVISYMPTFTVEDYENIIARMNGVPTLVDQTLVLLDKGLEMGITPPKITLRDVPQQVKNQIVVDLSLSPLMSPFKRFPKSIPPGEQDRLKKKAAAALKEKVIPAYKKLHDYIAGTYLPRAREPIALSDLPDGEAWYAFRARHYTTTKFSPRKIHEIGLSEVKRIRAEMEKIRERSGFQGTREEFDEFLRTDPKFFFKERESLLVAYRDIAKRADVELVRVFGKLPRLPYGVVRIPAYAEKSQTTAYYVPGSLEAGRSGKFYANTYNLKARPKWEMEALTLHEAVPGHHLQIALAQELEDLPEFRKHARYTAFVEGWGLYAESLGEEMGFYKDPYSKFGQLNFEMWRAIRLVVDTGIHAFGWSRRQAIDFFLDNSGRTEHDIVVEVDRYIVWPGQALAYKIGELKIKELRANARMELGENFNLRAFHDQVLGAGALPLDILEVRIKAWVAKQMEKLSSSK